MRDAVSFRITLDGEGEVVFSEGESSPSNAWRWIRASDKPFQLDAGRHQFTFNAQQVEVWFGEVVLSNDPEWVPED